MIIRSLTRAIRVRPDKAIAKILDAYDRGHGYPDAAAKILGVPRNTLHKWNRRLGIVGLIRERTGHRPGWLGSKAWDFRPQIPKRPHRSRAELERRFDLTGRAR